jgi:homocysteine S-methyltransferase
VRRRARIADGGLETTLVFHDGFELPHFAAFPLLADAGGRAALRRYYERYVGVANAAGVGAVLDTPTWRASADWGPRLGYTPEQLDEANRQAVELVAEQRGAGDVLVSGCVGPRGDGYRVETQMSAAEAERYHARQVGVLADAGVDLVSALTLGYADEAIGIVRAAGAAGVPVVISFTVETDGRLPDGGTLREAIELVDAETGGAVAYFMLNSAHPSHFAGVLDEGAGWVGRIGGIRANASTRSHAELDEAEELDAGDPDELAAAHVALRRRLPAVTVVGGCCGTDDRHDAAVCRAWHGAAATG